MGLAFPIAPSKRSILASPDGSRYTPPVMEPDGSPGGHPAGVVPENDVDLYYVSVRLGKDG
jgi:hypothetical protein